MRTSAKMYGNKNNKNKKQAFEQAGDVEIN